MRKVLFLVLLLFTMIAVPSQADPPTDEQKRINGIERAMQATVQINPNLGDSGSGFFIAQNTILTADHVTRLASDDPLLITTYDGKICKGTLVYNEEGYDLAVIKSDCAGDPLTLGSAVRIGQDAYAIGSPSLSPQVATQGMVAAFQSFSFLKFIISDVNADHGNSGGPLINSAGEVIGVVKGKHKTNPYLIYSVHLDDVKQFLKRAGL